MPELFGIEPWSRDPQGLEFSKDLTAQQHIFKMMSFQRWRKWAAGFIGHGGSEPVHIVWKGVCSGSFIPTPHWLPWLRYQHKSHLSFTIWTEHLGSKYHQAPLWYGRQNRHYSVHYRWFRDEKAGSWCKEELLNWWTHLIFYVILFELMMVDVMWILIPICLSCMC